MDRKPSTRKPPRHALRALREAHAEAIAFTVVDIAQSPFVKEYVIGYTSRQGLIRKEAYQALGFRHLVILADRLSLADAHTLEYALQTYIKEFKRMNIYRKYDETRRDGRYYPSIGRSAADPDAHVHSVYMAWSNFE